MGQPVSGLRDRFYRRLILAYRKEGVDSFLYRYFWTESVTELLNKHLPAYSGSVQPEDEKAIREALRKCLDLEPKRTAKKKADFWEELWLRDARVQAGLISKADYCLWLAEYLAAHDIYYKDASMWDGRLWLDALLKKGLDWKEGLREPGRRERKPKPGRRGKTEGGPQNAVYSDRMYTAQLGKDLRQLAEEIGRDRAKIAGRLDRLTEEYRSVLTARLKQMALHVKIKNWLQNSGYYLPTIREGDADKEPFQRQAREKQDFTLRMFEAYCADIGEGFFSAPDSGTDAGGWRLNGGFCLLNTDWLEALREELEGEEEARLYLPLGVDPRSGCVFFLAGKELYRELYTAEEARAKEDLEQAREALRFKKEQYERARAQRGQTDAWIERAKRFYEAAKEACGKKEAAYQRAIKAREDYEASSARFCFDFLRLDGSRFPRDVGGAFRLRPKFHENVKKDYQDVLDDFEWYCVDGDEREPGGGSPREAVRELNREGPARIPEEFRWAFDVPDSLEEASPEAAEAFERSRNGPDQTAVPGRKGVLVKISNIF